MTLARFFSWESKQTQLCNFIDNIADKNITAQQIDMESIPHGFGKEFLIGRETENNFTNQPSNTRYFFIHFMDEINNPNLCGRRMNQGILQINEFGQLSILDNHFNPMETYSSFVFENETLELHTNGWLYHRDSNQRNACNII